MSFQQHPRVSAPPRSDFITARPISQIASPLLLKRLQQQKKKLAEGSKTTSPISTGERTLECHSPATNNYQMAPTKPTPPSAKSNLSRRSDVNRRVEGMGAREMDQYLSKLKKENFDLKLTLYHSREKSAKTENELSETHAELAGALSRNAELTELSDQLHAELEARDQALGDAVTLITAYEDRVAQLERLLNVENYIQQNNVQRKEVRTEAGRQDGSESSAVLNIEEDEGLNDERDCGDKKSRIPNCLTIGISPFTHQPSPRLATPFRPRAYDSGGRSVSPSPSVNSNLIELNTPLSGSQDASSFLRSAFACIDTHIPLRSRTVSSNMSFINRCSSVMSDNPGGLQTGQSPDDDFVLDSPRLSELSDSSFASMYGERDDDPSEGYGDEGGMLSDNCDGPLFGEMPSRIDMGRRSETPNRRISPRREIIGFKARGRENEPSVFARNLLPPTPESISPRKCNGFKLDDEVPASRLPQSPVSSSEGKSIMTCKCSAYGTDVSDGSSTTSGINTPSTPPPGDYEEQEEVAETDCGNQKSSPHKSPSFADIANMQKRLGFRDRLDHGEGVRKSTGKVESLTLPRHVNSRIGSVRGGACGGRQSASLKAAPPPVKTNATFTSLPPTNIHTPPWTPRTPDSEATRCNSRIPPVIKRNDSWESIGSSLEKHDVKGKGSRGNGIPRRNTIALASNIAALPKRKVDTLNPTSTVDKRKSSIPALVRSNTTGTRDIKGVTSKPAKEKGCRNVN